MAGLRVSFRIQLQATCPNLSCQQTRRENSVCMIKHQLEPPRPDSLTFKVLIIKTLSTTAGINT
jgi:hypothetical protein